MKIEILSMEEARFKISLFTMESYHPHSVELVQWHKMFTPENTQTDIHVPWNLLNQRAWHKQWAAATRAGIIGRGSA